MFAVILELKLNSWTNNTQAPRNDCVNLQWQNMIVLILLLSPRKSGDSSFLLKSEEDIKRWQQNSEHLQAQKMGKKKWYQSYQVQIAELK